MMKKTLVALAAVAATGGAFAQATLTGGIAYGYYSGTAGDGTTASGGGMDTSTLTFTATEDLGNGNSVTAFIATDGTSGRGESMLMDNQEITLKMSGVALNVGSSKGGDWMLGASGSATYYGLDGKILSSKTINEKVSISLPIASGLTFSYTVSGPDNYVTLGTGNGGSGDQSKHGYNLKYAAGALTLQAGYVGYTNNLGTDADSSNLSRVGGNYNLGVAKVGVAMDSLAYGGGGSRTRSVVAASTTLGSLNLNMSWASTSTTSSTLTQGTRTGYVLGASHDLSKRTSVYLNYGNYLSAVGDDQNTSFTAVTLAHSF